MNINLVIHMDPVVVNDERANELKQTIQGIFRQAFGKDSNTRLSCGMG